MHPPWMHTPLQHAQNGSRALMMRTPLQRGVFLLTGSVYKVETDPQNRLISIPISISHIGELTKVNKGF